MPIKDHIETNNSTKIYAQRPNEFLNTNIINVSTPTLLTYLQSAMQHENVSITANTHSLTLKLPQVGLKN